MHEIPASAVVPKAAPTLPARRELTEDDFAFIPVEIAITPPAGIIEHLTNRWWLAHSEKGLAFYNPRNWNDHRRFRGSGSPQCYFNETIARKLAQAAPWDAEIIFLPSVFIRMDLRDYM